MFNNMLRFLKVLVVFSVIIVQKVSAVVKATPEGRPICCCFAYDSYYLSCSVAKLDQPRPIMYLEFRLVSSIVKHCKMFDSGKIGYTIRLSLI